LKILQTSPDIHPYNQKYHLLCLPPWSQPIIWVWIVNSRKIARWCQDWRFQVSLKRKYISSTYLISITYLPEDEQCLSMGEEVGTMQFRVYGEKIKKWWKKKEYKEKRDKEKNMYEKRKINIYVSLWKSELPSSLRSLGISKVSRLKIQTHLSNHVQSDNEDFLCSSRSLFAICTCPPTSKCVYFSLLLLDITLFSNDLFDESR
jgi:hypothetical protein